MSGKVYLQECMRVYMNAYVQECARVCEKATTREKHGFSTCISI